MAKRCPVQQIQPLFVQSMKNFLDYREKVDICPCTYYTVTLNVLLPVYFLLASIQIVIYKKSSLTLFLFYLDSYHYLY